MEDELQRFRDQIQKATRPEDVFGDLGKEDQGEELGRRFKRLARICHPDRFDLTARVEAERVFSELSRFHVEAEAKVRDGVYGKAPLITVTAGKQTYELSRKLGDGDVSTVYAGTVGGSDVVVKVSIAPDCNAFLANEQKQLKALLKTLKPSAAEYFLAPRGLISASGRSMAVFEATPGWIPLPAILEQYPDGLDPRHFVWMFKRLLTALVYVHEAGLVHGAVLPPNLLVNPATHGVKLIDFCFSVAAGERVAVKSRAFKAWYPPEVDEKLQAGPPLDIYMAARTMRLVLGRNVPHPMFHRVLEGCLIGNPARRQQTAVGLYTSIDEFAKKIYGPPKFIELAINATTTVGV